MRILFTLIIFSFCLFTINAQAPGQIMFVGFDADDQTSNSDQFAFVNLFPIPANTVLVFSDGEGTVTWTSPATEIVPGNVVNVNVDQGGSSDFASLGTIVVSGSFNLSGSNEIIEARLDGTCLAAIANDASVSLDNCTSLNTDFVVRISGDEDIMSYTGSTVCNGTIAMCQDMITDPTNWTTDDGSNDQTASYTVPSNFTGALLPVELKNFDVAILREEANLTWSTAMEINNSHFVILHSYNGGKFNAIGRVDGAGFSEDNQDYEFTHANLTSGMHYYKLRQVDFDGKSEEFDIRSIEIRNGQDISIYPTTVVGTVILEGVADGAEVEIYSLTGQLMTRFNNANNTYDASDLASGSYVLRTGASVFQFVKL